MLVRYAFTMTSVTSDYGRYMQALALGWNKGALYSMAGYVRALIVGQNISLDS